MKKIEYNVKIKENEQVKDKIEEIIQDYFVEYKTSENTMLDINIELENYPPFQNCIHEDTWVCIWKENKDKIKYTLSWDDFEIHCNCNNVIHLMIMKGKDAH